MTNARMRKLLDIKPWIELESSRSTNGVFSAPLTKDEHLYSVLISECDGNKALALSSQNDADPYIKIRTLLYTGRLEEAETELSNLFPHVTKSTERAELILEQARTHAYTGEWLKCEDSSSEGLRNSPVGLTMLALHQTRALARFELGNMSGASSDLQMAKALHTIIPYSSSFFYALAIEARIMGRDGRAQEGITLLKKAWKALIREKRLNLDLASALIKPEIELRRILGQESTFHALASACINNASGEALFEALAHIDCWASVSEKVRVALRNKLDTAASRFERVRKLMNALENKATWECSTVDGYKNTVTDTKFFAKSEKIDELLRATQVVICDLGLVLNLRPFKAVDLSPNPAMLKSISVLKEKPLTRAEYFSAMWGGIRYSPSLHDSWIANSLYRLRKHAGLTVSNATNRIELSGVVVL